MQLVDNMSVEEIKAENLDNMVAMLEENFTTALNHQAPEVTKVITDRRERFLGNIEYNPAGLLLTEKRENTGRCYWMQKLYVTVHK